MRILPRIQNEFVGISIGDARITCSWLQPINSTSYKLAAYASIPCERNELSHLRICNIAQLTASIRSFLNAHALQYARIAFALDGKQLSERVEIYPQASPPLDSMIPHDLAHTITGSMYMYPYGDTQHAIYQCNIERALLFHYQLLAITLKAHLAMITTQSLALLNLYRKLQANTFRHSQLTNATEQKQLDFAQLIPQTTLERLVDCSPEIRSKLDTTEWQAVAIALGLYLCEKE